MFELNLEKNPIVYVTRDLERGLGLSIDTPGYFIISNSTPFAKAMTAERNNVLLIEASEILDTQELMTCAETMTFIGKISAPHILVFKNTSVIEKICTKHNWPLLNPPSALAKQVEEKISQVEWLGELAQYLPPHHIQVMGEARYTGTPYVVQFNHAHTGMGTLYIDNPDTLLNLQTTFPHRPVRITNFIEGPMFTSNNVVTPHTTIVGNINYQITGLEPFTQEQFVTVGNDFALPQTLLSYKQTQKYHELVSAIGDKLRASGWKGLFGTDVILEQKSGELFLIEINARQPAGTTFESQLQKTHTIFEAHLRALHALPVDENSISKVTDGAQIILRNQKNRTFSEKKMNLLVDQLRAEHLTIIPYTNTLDGSDLVRIQSSEGIMHSHKQFNDHGKKIKKIIEEIIYAP